MKILQNNIIRIALSITLIICSLPSDTHALRPMATGVTDSDNRFNALLDAIETIAKELEPEAIEELFIRIRDELPSIDLSLCSNEHAQRLFTDHSHTDDLAIVAFLLKFFDDDIIFTALLSKVEPDKPAFPLHNSSEGLYEKEVIRVPAADYDDHIPRLNYGTLEGNYDFWTLKPELKQNSPAPEWKKAHENRLETFYSDNASTHVMAREHRADYILKYNPNQDELDPIVVLVSSDATEHHFNVYNDGSRPYMAQDTVTEDIWSRSMQPLDTDEKMLSYVKAMREFRRQRTLYLRSQPKLYGLEGSHLARSLGLALTSDALVRVTDEARAQAKRWLWTHNHSRSKEFQSALGAHAKGEYFEPVTQDESEVLMFLVGWGYKEREGDCYLDSPEQVELYPMFIGTNGRYYLSKGYRSRAWANVNFYPKERFAYMVVKGYNYVEILQPEQAQAPALFADEAGALEKECGPYLSDLSLNTERQFNDDQTNMPDIITDPKILRSWLLVLDVALRNTDAKFPNLSIIELSIPGGGVVPIFMKIDPDFEISENCVNIMGGRMGNPFIARYLEQRYRYWAFEKEAFDIDSYDLSAIRDAIAYVKVLDHKPLVEVFPLWQPKFGAYGIGELYTRAGINEFMDQTKEWLEKDVMFVLRLMTGAAVVDRPLSGESEVITLSQEAREAISLEALPFSSYGRLANMLDEAIKTGAVCRSPSILGVFGAQKVTQGDRTGIRLLDNGFIEENIDGITQQVRQAANDVNHARRILAVFIHSKLMHEIAEATIETDVSVDWEAGFEDPSIKESELAATAVEFLTLVSLVKDWNDWEVLLKITRFLDEKAHIDEWGQESLTYTARSYRDWYSYDQLQDKLSDRPDDALQTIWDDLLAGSKISRGRMVDLTKSVQYFSVATSPDLPAVSFIGEPQEGETVTTERLSMAGQLTLPQAVPAHDAPNNLLATRAFKICA
ncbi:hypothetical protein ACFL0T_07860 [Candidatus Omnitrophota bacterium]